MSQRCSRASALILAFVGSNDYLHVVVNSGLHRGCEHRLLRRRASLQAFDRFDPRLGLSAAASQRPMMHIRMALHMMHMISPMCTFLYDMICFSQNQPASQPASQPARGPVQEHCRTTQPSQPASKRTTQPSQPPDPEQQ